MSLLRAVGLSPFQVLDFFEPCFCSSGLLASFSCPFQMSLIVFVSATGNAVRRPGQCRFGQLPLSFQVAQANVSCNVQSISMSNADRACAESYRSCNPRLIQSTSLSQNRPQRPKLSALLRRPPNSQSSSQPLGRHHLDRLTHVSAWSQPSRPSLALAAGLSIYMRRLPRRLSSLACALCLRVCVWARGSWVSLGRLVRGFG